VFEHAESEDAKSTGVWSPASMRGQVKRAHQQKLNGAVAIHWRTEETRLNLDTFARFTRDSDEAVTVEDIYREDGVRPFGPAAGSELAPVLSRMDRATFSDCCCRRARCVAVTLASCSLDSNGKYIARMTKR
jgi:hypothetical protein